MSGLREFSQLRGLKKCFHLLPAGSLTNGGFIWEHLKAYTVNKPIVSCLACFLYWICAILERPIPFHPSSHMICVVRPPKRVPRAGCGEDGLRGGEVGLPSAKIFM